jgi:hypothetical protein
MSWAGAEVAASQDEAVAEHERAEQCRNQRFL